MLAADANPKRDAPTLAEVASMAGVSQATASRVLNNSARVSPTARRQVHDAMTRLGYVRQRAARSRPQESPSNAIAAIVCGPRSIIFNDPFYARVIDGAGSFLAGNDTPLLLAFGERPNTVERYLRGGHVSGAMIICNPWGYPLTHAVTNSNIPVVLIGQSPYPSNFSFIDADNKGGARQAVDHLIASGRNTIATIAGPRDTPVGMDRLIGYREALDAVDRPQGPVAYGDFTRASGIHAMSRLLDHRPSLDAVFVASDPMAMGAIHALRRTGRRVPEDVAVVGFDNLPMAAHMEPALTTVSQPVAELGTEAARYLSATIADYKANRTGDYISRLLPTTLIIRQSG